jgi:hypothetical protein
MTKEEKDDLDEVLNKLLMQTAAMASLLEDPELLVRITTGAKKIAGIPLPDGVPDDLVASFRDCILYSTVKLVVTHLLEERGIASIVNTDDILWQ